MAVVGEVGGGEVDEAPHRRSDHRRAVLHLPIPQLQMAAGAVVGVQEDDDVNAAEPLVPRAAIEVGVNVQEAAWQRLVNARPEILRVGYNVGDARELLEEVDEPRRLRKEKRPRVTGPI